MLSVANLVASYGHKGRLRVDRHRAASNEKNAVVAVSDVSFEVQEGELFTLLGPSGCGKTTILRCIAGLEHPDSGTIRLDGQVLLDRSRRINVAPNRRAIGMVFQSYAIWPHMSVFRNVAFPLTVGPRRQRLGRIELAERVERVLDVTQLGGYVDRPATDLSGGQQQRLALARAMVIQPSLMLLDEPLSNLDAKLRESLRTELKRLQSELGITTVYVTHDQAEALAVSSRIAVIHNGEVAQVAKPRDIYTNPANRFVAEFVGSSNSIAGVLCDRVGDLAAIDIGEGIVWSARAKDLSENSNVSVFIRPESLEIMAQPTAGCSRNIWRATVVSRSFLGDAVEHVVSVGKLEMKINSNPRISIPAGDEVYVSVSPDNVMLVPSPLDGRVA